MASFVISGRDRMHGAPVSAADAPVVRTAWSAWQCKRSLHEKGFFEDDTFIKPLLESNGAYKAQSPLTNRCYHLRAAVIRKILSRFLNDGACSLMHPPVSEGNRGRGVKRGPGTRQVVVLGAGLDWMPLAEMTRFLSEYHNLHNANDEHPPAADSPTSPLLIEVDLPEVVAAKRAALSRVPACSAGPVLSKQSRGYYKLIEGDLRDLGVLGERLRQCGVCGGGEDQGPEVLVVLEAVVGYLSPQLAEELLRWLSVMFQDRCTLLLVDELLDTRSLLAQQVSAAFASRDCALTGLAHFHGNASSCTYMLRSYGWRHVWSNDLLSAADRVVGIAEVERVQALEPFDEFAALHAFARHTLVAVASHDHTVLHELLRSELAPSPPTCQTSTTKDVVDTRPLLAYVCAWEAELNALEARVRALEDERCCPVIRRFRGGDRNETESVRGLFVGGRRGPAARSVSVKKTVDGALIGDLADIDGAYGKNFWVCELSGVLVGCVGLRLAHEREGKVGEVLRLSVAEHCRGRGLGKALLEAAERAAKAQHCVRVRATTIEELVEACQLYGAQGYELEKATKYGSKGAEGVLRHYVKLLEGMS